MLTIDGGNGSIANYGTVRINAGAGLAAGTYTPIVASTWENYGTYQAFGGIWNADHTFTVSAAQTVPSDVPVAIAQGERVLFGSGTGSVGATSSTSLTLTATAISDEPTLNALQVRSGNQPVLGGWEFVASYYTPGNPVYLSFNIGAGYSPDELRVWHYGDGTWTPYPVTDLTYNGTYASFTVTGFSGYAITPLPEPGSVILVVSGAIAGLIWWRRRK